MRFNPKASIGSGQVSGSRGGGGRMPMPSGMAAGGGGLAIIAVILLFLVQQCAGVNIPVMPGGPDGNSQAGDETAYEHCLTGDDANKDEDCARKAVALSLEAFWASESSVSNFRVAPIVTFSGQVSTACGQASSAVGPFYCPGDLTIYLDPTFFDQVLEGQLGGKGGDFVEPYVLGHEYGHHIQRLTGQMENVRTQQGPDSDAVKLELQADCYAGLWARAAESTEDGSGVAIFSEIDDADIQEALSAAYTVGDDHIQEVTGGRVDTGSWTHGSSQQRMEWFKRGFESGNFSACDIW
ncbi:neutral zinc metallopeptidase [Nocardioides sp. AE5]|uniref:KPN_02809 family neutral zinc metallopeptidase n=1 Tax=Nocardioides sp. AE5 TaxID=2962573 RepID=UPI0028820528|nr:neutral zinc metallopeptidase [Nocardioides sp. AE5]MDT0203619.1 neutral zinc metallopeptidase [Nocardioides sp. AE5]